MCTQHGGAWGRVGARGRGRGRGRVNAARRCLGGVVERDEDGRPLLVDGDAHDPRAAVPVG